MLYFLKNNCAQFLLTLLITIEGLTTTCYSEKHKISTTRCPISTKNIERYLIQALREDVYEIVPFIFGLANETFEAQKISKLSVLPGRGSDGSNFTPETALNNLQKEGKSQFCEKARYGFSIFGQMGSSGQ